MEDTYEHSIFDETLPVQIVYATFWQRLGALVVDYIVLLPFALINRYNNTGWKNIPLMIVVSVVARCYKPLFEYFYSATLGKKALSIIVTNASYGKPNLKEVLLRNSFHLGLGSISIAGAAYMLAYPQFSTASVFTSFGMDITSRTVYVFIAAALFFMVYVSDVIVFFVDRQNRSLHDLIGKTYVVKKLG